MVAIDIETALRESFAKLHAEQRVKQHVTALAAQAAVALIFAEDDCKLLFIKRAHHQNDPWSGHVALPGGRHDSTDVSLEGTARREVREEVGIELGDDHLWGSLSSIQARSRSSSDRIWVVPYVYRITGARPLLSLNHEAQAARWIPAAELIDSKARDNVVIGTHPATLKLPAWTIDDFTIWGLTYFIVKSLVEPLFTRA